jgi:S1-C subfamily serine protease
MTRLRPSFSFLFLVAASTAACSNDSDRSSVVLPSFGDVSDAPVAIQDAAQSVVRIGTAGEYATGSFISPNGILLTNNHVLGVDICPREGCYAQLTFMYQRHSTLQKPQTVFVVPLAVDAGLDMAVVQTYSGQGADPLSTPHYLTLDSRDPASLQGTHVHVVGHPEGHLKKWTQGEVWDAAGSWIWTTAYILPGSSGSPLLDDAGRMVGILHRGPSSQDLVSSDGIDEYSIGTASAALIAAMAAPLPAAMWSIDALATDDDVVQHQVVYRNARVANATVDGMPKQVLASLGAACDAALAQRDFASPEDLDTALTPCYAGELWIECRSDATGDFPICPPDVDAWGRRYQSVNDHYVALDGQLDLDMLSFAPAALSATMALGLSAGGLTLEQGLTAVNHQLNPQVASYLAAFGVDSYGGQSILGFENAYTSVLNYALWATDIASTALWLNHEGQLSGPSTLSLLQALASNANVDIAAKLYIEDVLYQSDALN